MTSSTIVQWTLDEYNLFLNYDSILILYRFKNKKCRTLNEKDQSSITFSSGYISGKVCKTKISITESAEQEIQGFQILAVDKAELDIAPPVLWDGIVGLLPAYLICN